MSTILCSADDVRNLSGVTNADFGVDTDEELTGILEDLIESVSDQCRIYADKPDWDSDSVPYGVYNLVVRIVSNIVEIAKQRRKTGIVQVSEFAIELLEDKVYTTDIHKTLDLYRNRDVISESSRNKIGFATFILEEEDE